MFRLRRLRNALAWALLGVALLAVDAGAPRAQDGETAEEVFHDHISGPIIQSKCITCHVHGGVSEHTRLVFVRSSETIDHKALNLRTLQNLLDDLADEGGGSYILNKIQGVAHGGGVQVLAGSADFTNMARFLALLGQRLARGTLMPETLFDTVSLASPRKTLRRAALIFAGRIPTDEEYAAVEGGDETALRATIRGLMEGPQFHEFLIRASNDRLLTDRSSSESLRDPSFVDYTNERYRLRAAAQASGDAGELEEWESRVQHGARRAPLELIAYVVENDRPYTEILTADYIMANPSAARAYGASTQFTDPDDVHEFKPARIVSYYLKGDGFIYEYDPVLGHRVIDPGPLITDYPHAGVLNTTAFLLRYPTTATNRNRARARWTYYHFLGLDVEKSASRTTDPVALADTDNPTLHNPNCTVCHSVLDPVAGAFQNYSDEGFYRINSGGLDSLDEFYKYDPPGRQDVLVSQRSRQEGVTFLGIVRLFADDDNELGLKNLRTFEGNRKLHLGLGEVVVRALNGDVVDRYRTRDVAADEACGRPVEEGYILWDCSRDMLVLPLDVPTDGDYSIEIEAWVWEAGEKHATLQTWMPGPFYREGDTWYEDMRTPGFAGAEAPHPDNSLQWLARQIVADERFAEATVEFWWPAIMGSDIAEFPEDAADADFEGLLLAASAQDAEMLRLANGFQDGFHGGLRYNLKDLLSEIVLSKWFRADRVTDADPVRRVALHGVGATRLLTPEELARKTAAITGVQWGRRIGTTPRDGRWPSALTGSYRLLYGGIDSDGVTERARDITPVMAGVAKRHAADVSCLVVMREFYLLPEARRQLFSSVAPDQELRARFDIASRSRAETQILSLSGALMTGSKSVRFSYLNPQPGRRVHLDRLDLYDVDGWIVASHEIEDVEWTKGTCSGPRGNHFTLGCTDSVDVPIGGLAAGIHTVEIVAWADQAGDEIPRLTVTVLDTEGTRSGGDAVRRKLVELHDKLLGVEVTPDSPEVEAAYQLFVDVRERRSASRDDWFDYGHCNFRHDHFYLDGILDGAVIEKVNERGHRYLGYDGQRVGGFLESIDFSDPDYSAQAWVVVLAAMMMDYRYLYL